MICESMDVNDRSLEFKDEVIFLHMRFAYFSLVRKNTICIKLLSYWFFTFTSKQPWT